MSFETPEYGMNKTHDLDNDLRSGSGFTDEFMEVERSLKKLGVRLRALNKISSTQNSSINNMIQSSRMPIVVNGLMDTWPCSLHWTPEHLSTVHGQKQVSALVDLPTQGVFFKKDQAKYKKTLRFSTFIEKMLHTPIDKPCYLAYERASHLFDEKDYDFATLLGSLNREPDTRVWIGSAGTRSMLHSDLKDNLFCQIWGEKKVILIPWSDSLAAYPCLNNIVNSRIDLADVNIKRFPRLKDITLYSVTMKPGDMLFIPKGWWHDIRSQTASISINHWFGLPLPFTRYVPLIFKLGPLCWSIILKDFFYKGLFRQPEETLFFFSPPSTGKRLYDLVRWKNFSKGNDPAKEKI